MIVAERLEETVFGDLDFYFAFCGIDGIRGLRLALNATGAESASKRASAAGLVVAVIRISTSVTLQNSAATTFSAGKKFG